MFDDGRIEKNQEGDSKEREGTVGRMDVMWLQGTAGCSSGGDGTCRKFMSRRDDTDAASERTKVVVRKRKLSTFLRGRMLSLERVKKSGSSK